MIDWQMETKGMASKTIKRSSVRGPPSARETPGPSILPDGETKSARPAVREETRLDARPLCCGE